MHDYAKTKYPSYFVDGVRPSIHATMPLGMVDH